MAVYLINLYNGNTSLVLLKAIQLFQFDKKKLQNGIDVVVDGKVIKKFAVIIFTLP